MAITLTIGGSNFLPQYVTNSARIIEKVDNKSNVLTLSIVKKSGQTAPAEGKEIIFKDGSRFLFAGYISRVDPVEIGEGQLFTYRIEATDYTYILSNKYAQKSYENQTLQYIVQDLLATYVHSGYAFTSTNVLTGPVINTIGFNHISLRKCFEKLSNVTGYIWWVDYEKDVHFVEKTTDTAPESITDSSANFMAIAISVDTSQVRNSVTVRGGREEIGSNFEQIIVGNGEAREWILREKPKTMVSIELDTGGGYVAQDFGVDPLDEEGTNDFMFNFQEKYIRLTAATTTPADGDLIRVTYRYEVPVITRVTDSPSVTAMQALEGGDGVHAYAIHDLSINSKIEARDRAVQELAEFANPLLTAEFETRTGLLQAGSIFKPGQRLTVNLPTWGISVDTTYVIQQVQITMVEDGTSIEYHYQVTFGGRLLGVQEFLHSLAGKEEVRLEAEEVFHLESLEELLSIAEVVTRNGNARSVNESASIAEAINRTNTTPPFKWMPSGTNPLHWNLGEWA